MNFITSDREFASSIDSNTTEDPSSFFNGINISASDECETKFTSSNINNYQWNLDFNSPLPEGNYNMSFTLDMINGNPIVVSTNFDLYYPVFN